jgi:hypothetical protein
MRDDPDRALTQRLRHMWEVVDPPAGDLADRMVFVLQLEDLEVEVLRLQEMLEPAGARGHESAATVTFTSDSLSVMVTLSGSAPGTRRIDGYIVPAAALRVELRAPHCCQHTLAGDTGRFAFPDAPTGLLQLVFHPTDGAAVHLGRPVVTPAVQL